MKLRLRLVATLLATAGSFAAANVTQVTVLAQSNKPPSRVFVFARGMDAALWYKTYDGTQWGQWETLKGIITGSPDACSPNPGEVIAFARGKSGELFYKRATLGNISEPWETFRTVVASDPGAVCRSGGKIDVFVRGTVGQGVWHAWYDNGMWQNQYGIDPKPGSSEFRQELTGIGGEAFGGAIIGGPDACSWGGKRLDVFVRGLDNIIWHKYRDDQGTIHEWESLGGLTMTSDPSAVALTSGLMSVFARGENNQIWTKSYNLKTDRWGPWLPLGGVLSGGPDVARTADNRADVFARGADGAIWHTSLIYKGGLPDLKSVPGWESLGGQLSSDPSVVGVNW
jgi:hypothetical protein